MENVDREMTIQTQGELKTAEEFNQLVIRTEGVNIIRLQDIGEARLAQTNIYDWADGSREIRYFDGVFRGDRVWIDNVNITGWTAAVSLDETNRTIMVGWVRAGEPDFRYYEMITVAEDEEAKNRTWHWYRKGRLFQRTIINEKRVSRDWEA